MSAILLIAVIVLGVMLFRCRSKMNTARWHIADAQFWIDDATAALEADAIDDGIE
jgi:Tfp pilus assembly protein PilV